MIVREILEDESVLDDFDFFNDYKDTARFLRHVKETAEPDESHRIAEILSRLEAGEKQWSRRMRKDPVSQCLHISECGRSFTTTRGLHRHEERCIKCLKIRADREKDQKKSKK